MTETKTFGNRDDKPDPNPRFYQSGTALALDNMLFATVKINEALDDLEKWIKQGKRIEDYIQKKRNDWPKFDTRN